MKKDVKNIIIAFIGGAILFGTAGVFAGQYIAVENPFPVKLNSENVSIQGYNIEDSTYFKLRDIADIIGNFTVDFHNDTIQLSKDGYVYDNTDNSTVVSQNTSDYVTDARNETTEFGKQKKVPYIMIDSPDVKAINDRINERYIIHSSFSEDEIRSIDYTCYMYNNLLSVTVFMSTGVNDFEQCDAYVIDVTDGSRVTNTELLATAGHTPEEYIDFIRTFTENNLNPMVVRDYSEYIFTDEFINADVPLFVDDYGQLYSYVSVHGLGTLCKIGATGWYLQ